MTPGNWDLFYVIGGNPQPTLYKLITFSGLAQQKVSKCLISFQLTFSAKGLGSLGTLVTFIPLHTSSKVQYLNAEKLKQIDIWPLLGTISSIWKPLSEGLTGRLVLVLLVRALTYLSPGKKWPCDRKILPCVALRNESLHPAWTTDYVKCALFSTKYILLRTLDNPHWSLWIIQNK